VTPSQIIFPKAILFDYDGVIVASESLHWKAWGKLLHSLSIPYDESELESFCGKTAPEILKLLSAKTCPDWQLTDSEIDKLCLQKNDYYLEFCENELELYPGVNQGLEWLREQKVKVAIVSNARKRELLKTAEKLGITKHLDLIIGRDDSNASKPDPQAYLFAARALGTGIENCLAIEDSPTGLQSSLLAGIRSAAVLTNFTKEILKAPVEGKPELKPAWIGKSMTDFFIWLKSLKQRQS